MKRLGIGLVGSGFMGRSHAHAFRAAPACSTCRSRRCSSCWPTSMPRLRRRRRRRSASPARPATGASWSPTRRSISSTSPRRTRCTCPSRLPRSRPASRSIARSRSRRTRSTPSAMVDAAERKGVKTAVGFNYLKNPMVALAREIVESGEIGEVVSFRGIHAEDYMTDAEAPFTWRLDKSGGHGVVADLGSHIISIARMIVGPIDVARRPDPDGDQQAPDRAGIERDARRRGRRRGAGARPLRERRDRIARGELGQGRPEDDARLRGHRLEGHGRGRPRAAATSCGSTPPDSRRVARASRPSSPGPTTSSTRNSFRRPATSSASTTSRPSR